MWKWIEGHLIRGRVTEQRTSLRELLATCFLRKSCRTCGARLKRVQRDTVIERGVMHVGGDFFKGERIERVVSYRCERCGVDYSALDLWYGSSTPPRGYTALRELEKDADALVAALRAEAGSRNPRYGDSYAVIDGVAQLSSDVSPSERVQAIGACGWAVTTSPSDGDAQRYALAKGEFSGELTFCFDGRVTYSLSWEP